MIKFGELLSFNLDLRGSDEVSIIVDGSAPDTMLVKSAAIIYGHYNVIWFSGNLFGISEEDEF